MRSVLCTLFFAIPVLAAAANAEAQVLQIVGRAELAATQPEFDQAGTLASAVRREAARLAGERPAGARAMQTNPSPPGQTSGNWISRHPVWFGTIVGAVAGAAIVGAASGSEAAFVGFYGGAAVGAVAGVLIGK